MPIPGARASQAVFGPNRRESEHHRLGGWDIANVADKEEAVAIVHEAIDKRLTFFDNGWHCHKEAANKSWARPPPPTAGRIRSPS